VNANEDDYANYDYDQPNNPLEYHCVCSHVSVAELLTLDRQHDLADQIAESERAVAGHHLSCSLTGGLSSGEHVAPEPRQLKAGRRLIAVDKPRTSNCCAVACVTPPRSQSVPDARQKSMMRSAPRTIGPITPLGDDAFGAERAGVPEDRLAVAIEVLREADAVLQCRARSIGVPERPAT